MFIIAIAGSLFIIVASLLFVRLRNWRSYNAKIDRLQEILDDFDELEELVLINYFKREMVNRE